MDDFQAYLFLLNDTIMGSLVFVPRPAYAGEVMLILERYNPYLILLVSLFGSVLASVVNWIIGNLFRRLARLERFPVKIDALNKAEIFFNHKGKWILLLSMLPIWGALFTAGAGLLRYNFFHFMILVIFSKFIGYSLAIFF